MLAKQLQGAALASQPVFIEDTFSTYLYTGNGSTQTITNGIDLSGKGGLVWMKGRSGSTDHALYDTARGATFDLVSNSTAAQTTQATGLTAFSSTGFNIGALAKLNTNAATYASWTFREQAKFFDIVTYTGNGVSPRTISHNLGSVPGFITVKPTSSTGSWWCFHRSLGAGKAIRLNSTDAALTSNNFWGGVEPTSTQFTVEFNNNDAGVTYVAYLFAHNAGGFGLTGTDNVISCGSYTGNGSATGPTVTLGYEPQLLLIKCSSAINQDWILYDNMRGLPVGSGDMELYPNLSNAEATQTKIYLTATGFGINSSAGDVNVSGGTYIYIAIRRGPMKVPTSGTSVFIPVAGDDTVPMTTGFPVDFALDAKRTGNAANTAALARLTGNIYLTTSSTAVEAVVSCNFASNTTVTPNLFGTTNPIVWAFRRAPSFMDVVCYTGTGVARTVAHNLGVVPELWIIKGRSGSTAWQVGSTALANTEYVVLNTTAAKATGATRWNSTYPTSSVFSLGTATEVNTSAATYVAYLFATLAGVSKVGSYTGNGSNQTIACGFTAGARFVMIKRTDSTGDWYVWDTARGIVSGNDPRLSLNSTAAEVTTDDTIDPDNSGFIVNQVAATNVNVTSATYIFFSIA